MILTTRPATKEDAEYIGRNLRLEDEREVRTATGFAGTLAVPSSFRASREVYTFRLTTERGTVAKHPFAIFGVSPMPGNSTIGVVWLLGTPEIRRAPLSTLREASQWVENFATKYTALTNVADERNDLHLRWIQLLGFQLGDNIKVNGETFRHFYRITDV